MKTQILTPDELEKKKKSRNVIGLGHAVSNLMSLIEKFYDGGLLYIPRYDIGRFDNDVKEGVFRAFEEKGWGICEVNLNSEDKNRCFPVWIIDQI